MPKPRGLNRSWDERAADILAGRGPVDAGSLIDLIHEVNPTGRGRRPDEEAARYALKSRLQSLLVREFADDLEVSAEPDPGVAALRHRYHRHDACHAVIATLDEDARSWVQQALDLAVQPASSRPRGATPAGPRAAPVAERDHRGDERSVEELLRDAEEAQAAYDYEEAQRLFARAVRASAGSVPSALAFLALAVDTLAADAEALAVEAELPAATLGSPGVALLLAIAAARSGDEALALRHLARAEDARAAEPLVLLARRALDEGDPTRAARRLREAEEHDPAHPEIRALGEVVARLRAGERAPREAALAGHLAAGREHEARALADDILARWPESEPARRAARQLAEAAREAEALAHVVDAEAAAQGGEHGVALELLLQALTGPLPAAAREAALGRVRELEALVRGKAEREQVERCTALLGAADPTRGLGVYAELEEALRARIRALVTRPTLGFIDQILTARPDGRVRETVDAALALERAAALADGNPAAAAALLAPHERALDGVPLARAIAEKARVAAGVAKRERAEAILAEAELALDGGHADRARAAFDRLEVRDLPAAAHPHREALGLRLAEAAERYALARRFERLRGTGSFLAARAAAAELAARSEEPERGRWLAAGDALREHVARTFALQVADVDGGPELQQNAEAWRWGRKSSAVVADGGHELYLATCASAWLFVRVLDLRTGRVVRLARLSVDAPMEEPSVQVHDDRLSLVSASGLIELALPSFEVTRRFVRSFRHDALDVFSGGFVVPGTSMLWGHYEVQADGDYAVRVVDLEGEHADRTVPSGREALWIPGLAEPRVACKRWTDQGDQPVTFHEAGGVSTGRFDTKDDVKAIVAHPAGVGSAVTALRTSYHLDGSRRTELHLVELSERYEVVSSRPIAGSDIDLPPAPEIVCAHDAGLLFLCFRNLSGADELMALRSAGRDGPRPRPLAELYRVVVPPRTTLMHDAGSHRAFALVDHAGGLTMTELGAEPPASAALGAPEPRHKLLAPLQQLFRCAQPPGEFGKSIAQYVELRLLPEDERPAAIERLELAGADDPRQLMVLFGALATGGYDTWMPALLERIQARFPDDPEGRAGRFTILAVQRRWAELHAALGETEPTSFGAALQQHHHHLRAVTAAILGDLEEARRAHAAAVTAGGKCELTELGSVLEALRAPLSAEDLRADAPSVRQHFAVLCAADARLVAGDAEGAVTVLERPLVWYLREVQTLARLAEAHLAMPATAPADRFRKALALATYVDVNEEARVSCRREELAPGATWGDDRTVPLLERAIAWLEMDQGVARSPTWRA